VGAMEKGDAFGVTGLKLGQMGCHRQRAQTHKHSLAWQDHSDQFKSSRVHRVQRCASWCTVATAEPQFTQACFAGGRTKEETLNEGGLMQISRGWRVGAVRRQVMVLCHCSHTCGSTDSFPCIRIVRTDMPHTHSMPCRRHDTKR
jgi:hypothetical protein